MRIGEAYSNFIENIEVFGVLDPITKRYYVYCKNPNLMASGANKRTAMNLFKIEVLRYLKGIK